MDELPERQRMPEALRDRMWAELEPQLEAEAPASRFRSMRAPLAVAASVVVLALAAVFVIPQLRGSQVGTASGGDAQIALQCAHADGGLPDPTSWRPAARIDVDATDSFLVIRNTVSAAVCAIETGQRVGVMGGPTTRADYSKLTAAHPYLYFDSMNYPAAANHPQESIHFGIVASNVKSLELLGPDNSVRQAIVQDGVFIVRTSIPEDSNQPNTNSVRVTLNTGQVLVGPLRS
ncbi:hypothetical protein [Kutzneria buriramensis]|uniref:Uncharacterized protein n=1 Tax=Kutzneria buriramensis TaxID=1045776 RepID=A0A3E0H4F5_9PSEU|nr:hypothetical protein [Kutzneria buriramensis]REH38125.1 hypothetical protein BCF44_114150 [Kutzneria buriramensis]